VGIWRIPNSDDGKGTRRKPIEEGDIRAKVRIFKNRREGTVGYWTMDHQDHYLKEVTLDDPYEDIVADDIDF
jgi:hypothetical protein